MRLPFTKMQGAGNDFVVLDATARPIDVTPELARRLGDRRFGVGADQILVVEPSDVAGVDFRYRIFNGGSGQEVEQCGNGARCLLRFVHGRGLTTRRSVTVQTLTTRLVLVLEDDGRVTVDMGAPGFELAQVPFDATGLKPREVDGLALWPLDLPGVQRVEVAVLSMGNPHAVQRVDDLEAFPVATLGPRIESHPRFARGVNAGFVQCVSRREIALRVHERGVGETLACGTGAAAAVAAGVRLGWLDDRVDVQTRGGRLTIAWSGRAADSVFLTGPAETVYEGAIAL